MRFVDPISAAAEVHAEPGADREVGAALAAGLQLPLAALRASIETLSTELEGREEGSVTLHAAQREIELLERNVQKLVDFTQPTRPHPLDCSVQEIALGALPMQPRHEREEHVAASSEEGGRLEVDGPILTRALRRLVENSLEAGSAGVRIETAQDDRLTHFAIVDSASESFDPMAAATPFQSSRPNQLGLGLALVHRDLSMLGGWLEFQPGVEGETLAVVTVPNRPAREQAA